MTYTFTTDYGGGVILAPCLQVLCSEIASVYPDAVNVGEIGDAAHIDEGLQSDHNPFVVHNGQHYIRAIDVGGSEDIQSALFNFINQRYAAHDARVYPYGYTHKDNEITTWFGAGGAIHYDAGDVGHVHISVTQLNGYSPGPNGWVPALDSREPWGLAPVASTGNEDDDVMNLLVKDGAGQYWCVAADMSSRTPITPAVYTTLRGTGKYIAPPFDQTTLKAIPVAK